MRARVTGAGERVNYNRGGFLESGMSVEMGVKCRELKLLAAFSAKAGRFAGPRN
jgi:hypothetical protein